MMSLLAIGFHAKNNHFIIHDKLQRKKVWIQTGRVGPVDGCISRFDKRTAPPYNKASLCKKIQGAAYDTNHFLQTGMPCFFMRCRCSDVNRCGNIRPGKR